MSDIASYSQLERSRESPQSKLIIKGKHTNGQESQNSVYHPLSLIQFPLPPTNTSVGWHYMPAKEPKPSHIKNNSLQGPWLIKVIGVFHYLWLLGMASSRGAPSPPGITYHTHTQSLHHHLPFPCFTHIGIKHSLSSKLLCLLFILPGMFSLLPHPSSRVCRAPSFAFPLTPQGSSSPAT